MKKQTINEQALTYIKRYKRLRKSTKDHMERSYVAGFIAGNIEARGLCISRHQLILKLIQLAFEWDRTHTKSDIWAGTLSNIKVEVENIIRGYYEYK